MRIDAFPHLLAANPYKEWTLNPEWNVQTWGSQSVNRITLYRNFRNFLKACRAHRVRVALSTWFREDTEKTARNIRTPEDHAQIWVRTLDFIKEWGELDNILYVDFCNECPLSVWAPFFAEKQGDGGMFGEASVNWMKAAIAEFKKHYPQIPVTFSCCHSVRNPEDDIHFLDFLEQHTWMTTGSDFYQKVGYNFERFSDVGYTNMALKGEELYRRSKDHYDQCLVDEIHRVAEWAKRWEKPVITTECWSVVDYINCKGDIEDEKTVSAHRNGNSGGSDRRLPGRMRRGARIQHGEPRLRRNRRFGKQFRRTGPHPVQVHLLQYGFLGRHDPVRKR